MKKRMFYSEAAYLVGQLLLALGTAMTAHGNFGISMVVAPAYILHLKLSEVLPWFSFGVAEYALQGLLLGLMLLLMKGRKLICLMSFGLAVLYGLLLDGAMMLVSMLGDALWVRIVIYIIGVLLCTAGLSLLFRSYLPPAAYELLVKTLSQRFRWKLSAVKTGYDCASLLVASVLSLCLFGQLRGVGVGTVVCALIYGALIGLFGRLWDRLWVFRDRFALRDKFEESQ